MSERRNRSGEVPRSDFKTFERTVPILCRGIGALAMYVQTVDGMKWRCNRCGAQVKVGPVG